MKIQIEAGFSKSRKEMVSAQYKYQNTSKNQRRKNSHPRSEKNFN